MTRDELYCAHAEQLGLRYPDAGYIRRAWGVSANRIESKVYLGGDIEIFISVMTPEGRFQHWAEPYKKIARAYGLFGRDIPTFRFNHLYGQD